MYNSATFLLLHNVCPASLPYQIRLALFLSLPSHSNSVCFGSDHLSSCQNDGEDNISTSLLTFPLLSSHPSECTEDSYKYTHLEGPPPCLFNPSFSNLLDPPVPPISILTLYPIFLLQTPFSTLLPH